MGSPYHNFSCGNIQNVLLGTDFWAKSINQSPYLVRQTSIPDSNGGIKLGKGGHQLVVDILIVGQVPGTINSKNSIA